MARPGPRRHRLPQRLDYTLIPAPLDLSLPLITEKSPLPAIIVTPSSPSSAHDYSIAFLAPPPKPSIYERFSSYSPFQSLFNCKARTALIIFLIMFVMVCHVVTHKLASRRPHLDFTVQEAGAPVTGWFDIHSLWGDTAVPDDKREFIIRDNVLR